MFATRTEQTTLTTGTGTIDLVPALTGRRNFSDTIGNGNQCYYTIQTTDEAQWEEGWGIVTAGSPDQLTRNTVIRSSNGDNLVNFPSGTKTVFIGDNSDTLRFGHIGQLPTSGGTANALTVAYAPAVRHIKAGMVFPFIAGTTAAGGPTTLSVNGLPALSLKAADGSSDPYTDYDFTTGSVVWVVADGTGFRILLGGPGSASRAYVDAKGTPVGAIVMFPGNAAPSQFLKANGALLSRITYASLWTYANGSGNIVADASWSSNTPQFSYGDGSTTFRIPDLRGYFPRFWDDTRGVDSGRAIGTYQADQNLQHNHTASSVVTDPGHTHPIRTGADGADSGLAADASNETRSANTSYSSVTGITVATSISNNGGTEARVKNAALLACIKY